MVRPLRVTRLVALFMVLAPAAPSRAASLCAGLLPAPNPISSARRSITTDDLVTLREIGSPDPAVAGPSPLAASPDGRHLAFVLRRGDPGRNTTCHALVVLDLTGEALARVVDAGGEIIRIDDMIRGLRTPGGVPAVVTPAWSPDGTMLAYRKRISGRTQVWSVPLGEGAARPITAAGTDIEDVAWSADGHRLIYAHRPDQSRLLTAFDRESRSGYLYDGRILPAHDARPQLPADLARAVASVPATGGAVQPATPDDIAHLGPEQPLGVPAPLTALANDGRHAGTERNGSSLLRPARIWADTAPGRKRICTAAACEGQIQGVWWTSDETELLFMRREGWSGETTALYGWKPGSTAPRRVFATEDALYGCVVTNAELVCLRQAARVPLKIVGIDWSAKTVRSIFDANPEFAALDVPRVERLRWRSPTGLPAWGDLVVPQGPAPTAGWPLVIVQYRSRGFLRGGTGDEYPIFSLAAQGIAVLSFERPPLLAQTMSHLTDIKAIVAATLKGWAERRSTHASLRSGLDLLLSRGDIDGERLGISGLSDGSATARYALIHGPRFRAAAISTCCLEQRTDMIYGGIVQADWLRDMGFPGATEAGADYWRPASLALNAARITTPLLLQLADNEYLQALEAYTALREHNQPVEMHVFPEEYHIKWQPAHRAAIYTRNLDWFRFWLQGHVDPDPAKADQYRRWIALRDAAGGKRP